MGKSYEHMANNYDKIEEAKKDDNSYRRQILIFQMKIIRS